MDKYTKHEAVDRTFLATDYVENIITHHWYYMEADNQEFNKLIDEALDKLAQAYQVVSNDKRGE